MKWSLSISEEYFNIIYKGLGIDKSLFQREPESDQDYISNFLVSKLWRLNNLYKIVDKDGNKIRFSMNRAQHIVYAAILRHPRIIILKSRQQGISTFWLISYFDDAKFNDNLSIGMLAQGLEEAATLLERVKLADDNFPPAIENFLGLTISQDNTKAIGWNNGSTIFIRTSFRSATLQRLHVSEMGKIAAKAPDKARELKTGTLQTIKPGNPVVIESTAEGRNNAFYDMWYTAFDHVGARGPKDFMPVFLSWVDDPDCSLVVPQRIDADAANYFSKLEESIGRRLSSEQKNFWVSQYRELGDDIHQEYPGTPEEAFAAVRDGTYYARLFREQTGNIVEGLYDENLDVKSVYDLGMNDTMVRIDYQEFGDELRIIGEYHNSGEAILHYVEETRARPYRVEETFLPHDARVRDLGSGKSRLDVFRAYGVRAKVLRRTKSVQNDIEIVRKNIPNIYVDASLNYIIETFRNYTKAWDDKLGVWKDKPLHNEWSNPADAIRGMVMASKGRGKTVNEKKVEKKRTQVRTARGAFDV
jgi:hypothetical protein